MTALVLGSVLASAAPSPPCSAEGRYVAVQTESRRLVLCDRGKPVEAYRVALGSGGVGKQKEGDGKVPLGEYALGPARPSASFHLFIPVGYPTRAQRRAGFTGGAIGIHGPARGWEKLGSAANTAVDWTLGCIALGSDEEIEAVARWVRERRVRKVVIGREEPSGDGANRADGR
jgi:murein L,D-transpeptidase YafK